MVKSMETLEGLLQRIRSCDVCKADLPLGPRPIVRASSSAKLLIIGQAPGTKVHQSGVPWDDPSGDRLRDWLNLDAETFYDDARVAIVPTGFCYPGRDPKGGDHPPRPECAPLWHKALQAHLKNVRLTLLVGMHAQAYHLAERRQRSMTETVRAWREYGPDTLPTPHPSWRTTGWMKKNPWFEAEILPELQARVAVLMKN
jgi:uracil-DNA glycosylase